MNKVIPLTILLGFTLPVLAALALLADPGASVLECLCGMVPVKAWGPAQTAADTSCPAAAAPVPVTDYAYDDLDRLMRVTEALPAAQGGNRRGVGAQRRQLLEQGWRGVAARIEADGDWHQLLRNLAVCGLCENIGDKGR